uniref:G-protein coupled receptors family 1 profile domain-containing protein n=1 Tax=Kryptolebias marmoratus TaxID=37003 RepID=A0A3Q3B848_KRYMA
MGRYTRIIYSLKFALRAKTTQDKLLNTSCKKQNQSFLYSLLISIVLSIMSVLTVTLNLLVIISITHFRQLHTSTNFLILSLAVSDFFVGFLVFFQVMMIDGCWYFGDLMCTLYVFLDIAITFSSVGNMVLISLDRYVAICDPLHYPTKVTLKRIQISVSLCWTFSLFYSSVLLRSNLEQLSRSSSCAGDCAADIGFGGLVAITIITFIIPITVIIVLYLRVFVVAVSQVQAMRSHIAAVKHHKVTAKKSEIKAVRTLGVVVLVFLMCLCPYFCISLSSQDTLNNTLSGVYVISLFYFNSCLNPLIYAFFYPWFRKAMKIIFTLQVFKSGSSDANIL